MFLTADGIHIYGKAATKPFRKMGHVTVLDRVARFKHDLEAMVLEKVEQMARGELA